MVDHSDREAGQEVPRRFWLTFIYVWLALALGGGLAEQGEASGTLVGAVVPALAAQAEVAEGDSSSQLKQWRKDLRQALRRFRRVVGHSLRVWVAWAPVMVGGLLWVLVVGALDRGIVKGLRLRGSGETLRELARGIAVYVRLLRDRGTPAVGKALLVAVLVYAGSPRDLVWDTRGALGFVDDGILLAIASRSFLRMCPQARVEAHARTVVARSRKRGLAVGRQYSDRSKGQETSPIADTGSALRD